MAIVYPKAGTATPSSGTVSITIPYGETHGILSLIFVNFTTVTTTFDVTVTNRFSNIIFKGTSNTGTLSMPCQFPISGDLTLLISSASVDEAFSYEITSLSEI